MEVYRNAGRKPTGVVRNTRVTIDVTQDEKVKITNFLKRLKKEYNVKSMTEALLLHIDRH